MKFEAERQSCKGTGNDISATRLFTPSGENSRTRWTFCTRYLSEINDKRQGKIWQCFLSAKVAVGKSLSFEWWKLATWQPGMRIFSVSLILRSDYYNVIKLESPGYVSICPLHAAPSLAKFPHFSSERRGKKIGVKKCCTSRAVGEAYRPLRSLQHI